jgi:hypothetical protein
MQETTKFRMESFNILENGRSEDEEEGGRLILKLILKRKGMKMGGGETYLSTESK